MRYYSKETGCTYLPGVHGNNMPADAVPIPESIYLSVIANPVPGKLRGHDADGLPVLVDALPPDPDTLADIERQWRDAAINQVQWLINRHRDEVEIGLPTTLVAEQFSELLLYVQRLRDWPAAPLFPDVSGRPIAPDWLAEQTE